MNEEIEQNTFVLVYNFLHRPKTECIIECVCRSFKLSIIEHEIPVHYSYARMTKEEAMVAGWRITTDPEFVPPGDKWAWLCPECAERKLIA